MIKVLIADDEPLVRIGLKSSIDWEGNGFELVGEASNGEQALDLILEVCPDILITDIKMPVMDGIQLIKEAKHRYPQMIPVVLSCHDDYEFVREAMKLGAADYFLKTNMVPESILKIVLGLREKLESNRERAISESKNKRIIGECISILTDNFIKDLISDLVVSEQELDEKMNMYKLECLQSKYVLMVLHIDDFAGVKKKYVEKDEKLLQFSIKNMLEELYGKVPGFRMFIDNSGEYILCWPAGENGTAGRKLEEQTVEVGRKIHRIIKDYLNISVSIGISLTHKGISEVKEAYHECLLALKFKFIRGKGSITNFSDVRRVSTLHRLEILDEQVENRLKFAVKSMDIPAAAGVAEYVKNKILNLETYIDEKTVRKVFTGLAESFNMYLRDENPAFEAEADPYLQILEAEDIHEIHLRVDSYFSESMAKAMDLAEDRSRSLITQAQDYINSHYDKGLSLQFIADKVGLNPSYFSRFFKKETGESFIDYLTRLRIDKSRQLLAKGVKAVDVAEKVGYQNYTYFSKLFKKVVGVNPSEYSESR